MATCRRRASTRYAAAARLAHSLGVGINAGHDLDLDNLTLFRTLPHLDEVSIGHALISHALYVGLDRAVRDYLGVLGSVARLATPLGWLPKAFHRGARRDRREEQQWFRVLGALGGDGLCARELR